MRIYCGILLSALACWGQSVAVSVVGGIRGDDMGSNGPDNATSVSKRYVVGPSVEIGLPRRFAMEVQALYRRQGYQVSSNGFVASSTGRANSWEFPVLIKYRLPVALTSPFLETGYAPRVVSTASAMATTDLCNVHPLGCFPPFYTGIDTGNATVNWPVSHGVIVGGGVQFGARRLQVAPTVRYTRWSNTDFSIDSIGPWHSAHNQLDVLLNIGWKLR